MVNIQVCEQRRVMAEDLVPALRRWWLNSGARRSAGVRLRPRAEGGGPASAMEGEEEEGTGQGLAGAGHGRGRASIGGGAAGAESTAALASGWIRPRARVRP